MRLPLIDSLDEQNVDESIHLFIQTGTVYRQTPENNLTVAVLAEAISLLIKSKIPADSKKGYAQTVKWLNGEYESNPGWSFEEVAERIGWDAGRLRDGINAYVEANRGKAIKGLFIRANTRALDDGDEE